MSESTGKDQGEVGGPGVRRGARRRSVSINGCYSSHNTTRTALIRQAAAADGLEVLPVQMVLRSAGCRSELGMRRIKTLKSRTENMVDLGGTELLIISIPSLGRERGTGMSDGGRPLELASMRVSYEQDALEESRLEATWYEQLRRWLADAAQAGLAEPNAMVLATADSGGRPSSRAVLCKGLDWRGVVFFTHYDSPKSHDLLATGLASATFPWFALQRQASLRGTAEKVSRAEATAYWATRPRGSQLGAWASEQSQEVAGRAALDAAFADAERQFGDVDRIPVPENWGGWRIRPQSVEFWQGRPNRMHDRLVFERLDGDWRLRRLAP